MAQMTKYDRLSSLFWLLIGFYVCVHSYSLGVGKPSSPGQGFIFFLAGAALSVLSILQLLGTFFEKSEQPVATETVWAGLRWQKILLVLLGTAAYLCFFNSLGFFLSTLLFMILLFRIVEPTRWWVVILTALITVSVSYAVFARLLKIPFPRGFIGI